jgi:hypothetical protein
MPGILTANMLDVYTAIRVQGSGVQGSGFRKLSTLNAERSTLNEKVLDLERLPGWNPALQGAWQV